MPEYCIRDCPRQECSRISEKFSGQDLFLGFKTLQDKTGLKFSIQDYWNFMKIAVQNKITAFGRLLYWFCNKKTNSAAIFDDL